MAKATDQRPKRRRKPKATTNSKPRVKTKPKPSGVRGLGVCFYGPSGVGKTSLAMQFENAVVIHDTQETGAEDLIQYGQVQAPKQILTVETWQQLLDVSTNDFEEETLIFDSLTGFEKLCFRYHCAEQFDNDWSSKGFFAYQQGPKNAAKTDWPEWIECLATQQSLGKNIILIAHSQIKNYNNPVGPDYDRIVPYLDKESWAQIHRWCQALFFLDFHVPVIQDERNKLKKPKPDTESLSRYLYTEKTGAWDAKNRMGLPHLIDMGDSAAEAYRNLMGAIAEVSTEIPF